MIEAAKLKVGSVSEEYNNTVAKGNVISTDPVIGSSVDEGTSVNLVISLGAEGDQAVVPNLVGKKESVAQERLTAAGLKSKVTYIYSDKTKGTVISQTQKSGSKVEKGSVVQYSVSLGSKAVEPTATPKTEETSYSYEGSVTVSDNPFSSPDEDPAMIKVVLTQDGKSQAVWSGTLQYDDFPKEFPIKGWSENSGTITVSKDGLKEMDDKTLVIVVDTHRASMVEGPSVLEAAKKIVVFDHHRKSAQDFIEQAVLLYHEPYASSTSELITEMIQHIGKRIKLRSIEADALLAGITVDTKNFAVKTGAITFESAGFLRRNGADSIRVRMLFQNDIDSYKAKATAVRDAELYLGSMALSVCPANRENSTLTAAQAADDLMNVTGVKASFVCCKVDDVVYVSARSFGDVNVQRIMEKLGGGGHFTVSGAQLKDCSAEEAKERVRSAIDEYLKEETT